MTPPTPEFCRELIERARRYGWTGDYVEVQAFVTEICAEAGIQLAAADVKPYGEPLELRLWKCGGPTYRTRDGRKAIVLESNVVMVTPPVPIWQGRIDGQWTEWNLDGTHAGYWNGAIRHGADCNLDIVGTAK